MPPTVGFDKIGSAIGTLADVTAIINRADLRGRREHVFYLVFNGTYAAGAIQLESAHDPGYTGTWFAEGAAVSGVTNSVKAIRLTGGVGAIRARVSIGFTNGVTVDVYYGFMP